MPRSYDARDLQFTWNGDYLPGDNGDLADTSEDQIQALVQEIQSIVNSSLGDWEEHPTRAADLYEFLGEPNTRETGRAIERRVAQALISNGVTVEDDLNVRTIPVGPHTMMVIIQVQALATVNNSLQDHAVVVNLVFDTVERNIHFLGGS